MKFLATLLVLLSFESHAGLCDQDAKKFCQGTEPGRGQLAKCLDDYLGQLSPSCVKELKEFKAEAGKKNPCFEELGEFCSEVLVQSPNLELCLLKNENRLGSRCSSDFKKKKPGFLSREVCANDIVSNCFSTVSGPDAGTTRCLIKNKAKLSPLCKKKTEDRVVEMKKKNPCFDEIEKYCPTQIQFSEIQDCMKKKLAVLTPVCKTEVQEEINKEKTNPCYADLRKHCKKGLTASDQHHCLSLNESELSNSCRQFRSVEAGKVKKMVELCEADRLKLCPKAPFQNGMILKCLKENSAKVSPGCKALL